MKCKYHIPTFVQKYKMSSSIEVRFQQKKFQKIITFICYQIQIEIIDIDIKLDIKVGKTILLGIEKSLL